MKTMLLVAAGVAFGLTAAIGMLIEVLERLGPPLLVVVLLVIVLRLVRRRGGHHRSTDQMIPRPSMPMVAPSPACALPTGASDHAAPYLRWGPAACEDLDAPVTVANSSHLRRARAGVHPPRPIRGHRP